MASPQGVLGTRLFISDAAIASTIDTEREFSAQSWTEVGLITQFGEYGRVYDLVTFQAIYDGRTYKFKGANNDGQMTLTVGQDLSDAGQDLLYDASNASTQDNWGFRMEFNNAPSSVGGPSTVFFRALPMSFRSTLGAVNSVFSATSMLEINSPIVTVDPAELYDTFDTGSSLTHYELFNGSDAEAVDPVISANTLVMVTGDAGTGFAADGTQAIGDTGYTLAAGAKVLEARLKLSAITTVSVFFGWTDQKAALEIPIESAASADTITTNATDAIGFMFDTSMATDNIWLTGVNNDADETPQNSATSPVADTYITLRIETNTAGDATFYINGVIAGSQMTTAAATGVTLYPTLAASARTTASRTMTVDYLYLRQD
jgi:hypothetical protein